MFTINFKSKANSREASQVKIEMIIYCPGYARVPKVTNVIGLAKDWNEKSQLFRSKSHEATEKNKSLAEMPCANLRKNSTAGSFPPISSTR
ncbi:hypothetical protein AGMMS50239_25810 [Bacteroidia bacterium]|nr:hypothetical protein AGMMS50239_25810 [Bacteroidia bacterium]